MSHRFIGVLLVAIDPVEAGGRLRLQHDIEILQHLQKPEGGRRPVAWASAGIRHELTQSEAPASEPPGSLVVPRFTYHTREANVGSLASMTSIKPARL